MMSHTSIDSLRDVPASGRRVGRFGQSKYSYTSPSAADTLPLQKPCADTCRSSARFSFYPCNFDGPQPVYIVLVHKYK